VSQHAGVSHEPALGTVFNRWVGVVHDDRVHSGGHAGGEGGGKEEMGMCKMQYTAGLESPGMITGSCALHFFFFTLWTADSEISYNCARESPSSAFDSFIVRRLLSARQAVFVARYNYRNASASI
jgi:hypothetical protein